MGRSPSAQASGASSDSDLDAGLFTGIQELHLDMLSDASSYDLQAPHTHTSSRKHLQMLLSRDLGYG